MAVNFPSNPTNGQTITANGITYAYDSTQGVWSDNPQGLAQAIDALTDVDTSTTAPTNGQILQWNSTDSEWQPADSSAGVTVYATIDDLPLTGVTEGSMALVDSTDKLYIYSDTGWYSISIVNQTPSISGVNATYTLASDGTATTVTVTATDPEGLPVTYSIVSDTSGNVATVTQGTGSNTNQWTITPSTNTANAGSFTLVFRASDGTNVASASSTFTLVFSIENSNYTTALITSVGANNAVNNSFDDASTNNHTITANGNVTQNTFSPYRHGGNAVSFAGTNSSSENYLWINAAIVPATGSWTYESWVRVDRKSDGERHSLISWYTNGVSGRGNIFVRADNETNPGIVFVYVDGMSAYPQSTTRIDDGAWHHVVVERDGNVWSVWIDGTREDQQTQNVTLNTSVNTRLGHIINTSATSHSGLKGLMRDVRFSTSARYQGAATITVPTEDQTTTTGYALLCCQSFDPFTDKTGTREITVYSSTSVKQVGAGPYDHNGYSASSNGGSIAFDGTGDYLTTSAVVLSNSTAFTIEMWYYNTSSGTGEEALICQRNANSPYNGWRIYNNQSATDRLRFYNGTSWVTIASNLAKNQWHHIAVVSQGSGSGQGQCYLNGVAAGSAFTTSSSINHSTNLHIGTDNAVTSRVIEGYLSDVRVVNGTAVYTSAFTPPTAPLTAITNTSLLLNGTDAGIIDKSQSVKTITLNGDAKSSTTQSKFLTSSMYFDGTGDYVEASSSDGFDFGSLDWTMECWVYLQTDSDTAGGIIEIYKDDNNYIRVFRAGGPDIQLRGLSGGTTQFDIQSSAQSQDTWIHVAAVRNSSTVALYLDGTRIGTDTSFTIPSLSGARVLIGLDLAGTDRYFTGYISDVRITKGLARYTAADETANIPSAALGG